VLGGRNYIPRIRCDGKPTEGGRGSGFCPAIILSFHKERGVGGDNSSHDVFTRVGSDYEVHHLQDGEQLPPAAILAAQEYLPPPPPSRYLEIQYPQLGL
jgi:hypothetical protein